MHRLPFSTQFRAGQSDCPADARAALERLANPWPLAKSSSSEEFTNEDEKWPVQDVDEQLVSDLKLPMAANPGRVTQRWGILEASRRISAVRSASIARTRAMRDLPSPPRDSDGRPAKRNATPTSLDDLLREEWR